MSTKSPHGWVTVPLHQLIDSSRALAYGVLKPGEHHPGGVRLLKGNEVRDGSFDLKEEFRISLALDEEFARTRLRGGEILLTVVGSVGRSAVVPPSLAGANVSRAIAVIPVLPGLEGWVQKALQSPQLQRAMVDRTGGTAQPVLNLSEVRELEIPVPPVSEQHRIVAKLETLLARSRRAKDALDNIPALLERVRQSVLAAAFRGELTGDWRQANPDVEPASKLLEQIRTERRRRWETAELKRIQASGKAPKDERWKGKYEEPEFIDDSEAFGPIAELGWVMVPAEGLCDPNRGVPYGIVQTGDETEGGVPTVRCGDLKDFSINIPRLKRVAPAIEQQYARTRLSGGEVLLAIRGTVGGVAVAADEMRGMNISREVAMLPVLPGVDPRFVMYLLGSPAATAILAGRTKGVAQQGVNLSDLRSFPVPLPSLAEQAQIVRRIDAALSRARDLARGCSEALARMPSLEAAVLAKAFRGELVSQDSGDEPASVFLERVRTEREQMEQAKLTSSSKRRRQTKVA